MIETHSTSMNSAHYSRMGKEECAKIHLASLEILQRVGVDVHDEKARGYLVRGGAKADGLRARSLDAIGRPARDRLRYVCLPA